MQAFREVETLILRSNPEHLQAEKAFSLGEANVALEGFDAPEHPLYETLKAKVLAGEMTASEMGDAILNYAVREQTNSSAA
jgi:hypothetical protein